MMMQSKLNNPAKVAETPSLSDKQALVICRNAAILDAASAALSRVPGYSLRSIAGTAGTLPEEAGEAVAAAALVIAEIDDVALADPAALGALAESGNPRTRFIGITDADLPLSRARQVMKLGFSDVVPVGEDADEFRDGLVAAMRDILDSQPPQDAAPQAGNRKGAVITVARGRGGLGATTLAVNLADLLREPQGMLIKSNRHSVALVDLDIQFGNAGSYLDLEDNGAMVEIARSPQAPDAAFLASAVQRHESGLAVLTAPSAAIPLEALDSDRVGALLDVLRTQYDYVVVDLPQALVGWLEAVIARTDLFLVVTDTSVPAIRSTRRLLDLLTEDVPTLHTEIVINRERRPLVMSHAHKIAADALGLPLKHFLAEDSNAARRAVDRGETLDTVSPNSSLTKSLKRLTGNLLHNFPAQVPAQSSKAGS